MVARQEEVHHTSQSHVARAFDSVAWPTGGSGLRRCYLRLAQRSFLLVTWAIEFATREAYGKETRCPLLFILVMEVLNALIHKVESWPLFRQLGTLAQVRSGHPSTQMTLSGFCHRIRMISGWLTPSCPSSRKAQGSAAILANVSSSQFNAPRNKWRRLLICSPTNRSPFRSDTLRSPCRSPSYQNQHCSHLLRRWPIACQSGKGAFFIGRVD
jgi:hypothetical protein